MAHVGLREHESQPARTARPGGARSRLTLSEPHPPRLWDGKDDAPCPLGEEHVGGPGEAPRSGLAYRKPAIAPFQPRL